MAAGPTEQLQPTHIDAEAGETGAEGLRIGSVEGVAVLVDGDLGDDGHAGRSGARGQHRLVQFVDIAKGFQQDQVHAFGGQHLDLLAEGSLRLFARDLAEGLNVQAQRSHAAGHQDAGTGGGAGQLHAGAIDVAHAGLIAVAQQAVAVGAEGVGLQHLRSGLDVVGMDGADDLRLREVEFVIAAVDEDTFGIEQGAHGTVTQKGPTAQPFQKR